MLQDLCFAMPIISVTVTVQGVWIDVSMPHVLWQSVAPSWRAAYGVTRMFDTLLMLSPGILQMATPYKLREIHRASRTESMLSGQRWCFRTRVSSTKMMLQCFEPSGPPQMTHVLLYIIDSDFKSTFGMKKFFYPLFCIIDPNIYKRLLQTCQSSMSQYSLQEIPADESRVNFCLISFDLMFWDILTVHSRIIAKALRDVCQAWHEGKCSFRYVTKAPGACIQLESSFHNFGLTDWSAGKQTRHSEATTSVLYHY